MNKIGNIIKKLRTENHLTQQELADKLFVTDKAISKWERGLSFPDVALLEKISDIFNVNIDELLNISNQKMEEYIKKENKRKKKKIILFFSAIIIIFIIIIIKNKYFGYKMVKYNFNNSYIKKEIELGVPYGSFMRKENSNSISFKNFRSKKVLEIEIKDYLKKLDPILCNDTIYYYDENNDITIINYGVKDKKLYRTIDYEIRDKDYCFYNKLKEYGNKIILGKAYVMNDVERKNLNKIIINFIPYTKNKENKNELYGVLYVFKYNKNSENNEEIYITNYDSKDIEILEESNGTYEIKNNQLIFSRKNIVKKNQELYIPIVSIFEINDNELKLVDNYLSKYEKEVILK